MSADPGRVHDTVMFRPLPFSDPPRFMRLWESNPEKGWPTFSASHPNFLDWRAQNHSFEQLAAQSSGGFTLTIVADNPAFGSQIVQLTLQSVTKTS